LGSPAQENKRKMKKEGNTMGCNNKQQILFPELFGVSDMKKKRKQKKGRKSACHHFRWMPTASIFHSPLSCSFHQSTVAVKEE